jgi:hypothetical protein
MEMYGRRMFACRTLPFASPVLVNPATVGPLVVVAPLSAAIRDSPVQRPFRGLRRYYDQCVIHRYLGLLQSPTK